MRDLAQHVIASGGIAAIFGAIWLRGFALSPRDLVVGVLIILAGGLIALSGQWLLRFSDRSESSRKAVPGDIGID